MEKYFEGNLDNWKEKHYLCSRSNGALIGFLPFKFGVSFVGSIRDSFFVLISTSYIFPKNVVCSYIPVISLLFQIDKMKENEEPFVFVGSLSPDSTLFLSPYYFDRFTIYFYRFRLTFFLFLFFLFYTAKVRQYFDIHKHLTNYFSIFYPKIVCYIT